MRPLVSSSVALAAVSLVGVALAGASPRLPAGWGDVRKAPTPERITAATPAQRTAAFLAPPEGLARAALEEALRDAPGPAPRTTVATETYPRQTSSPQTYPPQADTTLREISLPPEPRTFFFTRAIYSSWRGGWGRRGRGDWATDYPKADRQFLVVLKRLTNLDAYEDENAVRLDDPALRRYPFLYALEVGRMDLSREEVHGLRDYLNAGGFLVIDDFWGPREWENFEIQISRVLPGRPIVDIPRDHALFSTFYEIGEILQVPNVGNGRRGGPTWECWECETPEVKGIFDDDGRLMVVINFNTDLGDAWEWAEDPWYPLPYSTFAYQMGVNMIVYAMSH